MRKRFSPRPVFKIVYPKSDWNCKECGKLTKGRGHRPKEATEPCVFRNLFMTGGPPDRYCVPCAERLQLTIKEEAPKEEKVG